MPTAGFLPPDGIAPGANAGASESIRVLLAEHNPCNESIDVQLRALLTALMHFSDHQGCDFGRALADARLDYAAQTRGQGNAGAAHALACETVAEACGFYMDTASGWIAHPGLQLSYPSWQAACRAHGIDVAAPDPYEVAARAAGWTCMDERNTGQGLTARVAGPGMAAFGVERYLTWRACCEAHGIAPVTLPPGPVRARLRLDLEVTCTTNGTPVSTLEGRLAQAVTEICHAGYLTGSTEAEVDGCIYRITSVG